MRSPCPCCPSLSSRRTADSPATRRSSRPAARFAVSDAGFDAIKELCDVARRSVHAGRQAEIRIVRMTNAGVEILHPMQHQDGQEHFFAPQRMIGRRLGERRQGVITAREIARRENFAAEKHLRSALAQAIDVAAVLAERALADHRTQPVFLPRRIAHADRLHSLHEFLNQRVRDRLFDIQARQRRAFLSAHAERAAHDAGGSSLEIGVRGDDAGILAAHLGDAGFRVTAAGELAQDAHARFIRAGERDAAGQRMRHERIADRCARSHQIAEDARREVRHRAGSRPAVARTTEFRSRL